MSTEEQHIDAVNILVSAAYLSRDVDDIEKAWVAIHALLVEHFTPSLDAAALAWETTGRTVVLSKSDNGVVPMQSRIMSAMRVMVRLGLGIDYKCSSSSLKSLAMILPWVDAVRNA